MPAPKNKTYELRPEVAFALSTGRPQLLVGLRRRLVEGKDKLNKDEQIVLLDLVRDCIEDREKERTSRLEIVEQIQEQVSSKIYEMGNRLSAFSGDIDGLFDRMLKKHESKNED